MNSKACRVHWPPCANRSKRRPPPLQPSRAPQDQVWSITSSQKGVTKWREPSHHAHQWAETTIPELEDGGLQTWNYTTWNANRHRTFNRKEMEKARAARTLQRQGRQGSRVAAPQARYVLPSPPYTQARQARTAPATAHPVPHGGDRRQAPHDSRGMHRTCR